MTIRDVLDVHAQADDRIGRLVSQAVDELGVPSTPEEVGAMAEVLHAPLVGLRRGVYAAEVLDTGRELDALGFEFQPAFERLYPVAAVESMVSDAVGLGVQPNTIPLALLDDASRESARVGRVVPFLAADDPVVARVVRERIAATAARHVRAAGRQMVADTVEHGQARRAGSHEPVRIGFARVLSGRENCAFCAMLASRGAVYRKDTVVRRRDGRKYHNHCDCVARLVVHGQPWEGQEQADALFELYKDTVSKDADGRTDWLGFAEAWAQEVDKARFSPLGGGVEKERGSAPPKIEGVSRKGSKRTIKSAVSGANPTGDMDNCIRCVNAWAMRKLGYDVVAAPGQPNEFAEESTLTWKNSQGESPTWILPEGHSAGQTWQDISGKVEKKPEGSFGFVRYKRGYPHVVAWEISDGKVQLFDPQQPKFDVELHINESVPGSIRWVDLTGFRPTYKTVQIIEEER